MADSDVVIVGGGVVGHTLARGLVTHTSLTVTLVDATDINDANTASAHGPGFDTRIIALSKRTADAFGQLSVPLSSAGATPIHHIQVTDQGHSGFCAMDAGDYRLDHFGQVVSLAQLGATLHDSLKQEAAFTYLAPATVVSATPSQEHTQITLADGKHLRARLLVLADGGRSGLAEALGYQRQHKPYQQTALIANVHTSEPHHNRAYERFTAQGPVAFLPFDSQIGEHDMPGHGFSVVWTRRHAHEQILTDDAAFIRSLQQAMGYRQGRILRTTPRVSYPLGLSYTTEVAGQRSVIVGNAAQTLHPIAGQGFNLGLRDCLNLVSIISGHPDAGSMAVTQRYAKSRRTDRQVSMTLTDTLVHTFSNTHLPLVAARNAGLFALAASPLARRQFVTQTTGFGAGSAFSDKDNT
ncbi:2-octaprenyl-6-methoxyphenyl hydroxylase [Alteromonas halophila]|uniref:2-octaprenyl-6-methoxyphenol hydroxylase n=1 Tax=Alteromonas halophila TaxID=516698 RepID=A0A918JQF6_9ALTE|nr:2-octaprenyl-6-methoxyphenyl hydroxylase [Alteromonas halophila]GGW93847.1 2-octaprenyl-6-methoxyphenol hydroxylase [Alteromonas halophila]